MRSSLPGLCPVLQRNDEEAVVDRGGTRSILKTHFEKEDLEGERLFFSALHSSESTEMQFQCVNLLI